MHDLIYCFRMLRKRPSFTLVAVLTLALAIGASTALFSIVNVVVLNPFPYNDPARLFFVRQSLPKLGVQDQLDSGNGVLVAIRQFWASRCDTDRHHDVCFSSDRSVARRVGRVSHSGEARCESRPVSSVALRVKE